LPHATPNPNPTLTLRRWRPGDEAALWQLKYRTIHTINRADYSAEQCAAWAPDDLDPQAWQQRVVGMDPFVVELDGELAGFADLQADGYIDHFFCAAERQGCGVGRALMNHIHQQAQAQGLRRLYAQVSLTARPFFEHAGFVVVSEQQLLVRGGVALKNFGMEKQLPTSPTPAGDTP
jgi:putative acetyltransferase